MAHACNPSYSGGRDQEDPSSKPAWVNSSQDTLKKKKKKKKSQKRVGRVAQGGGPEFKFHYCKKTKILTIHLTSFPREQPRPSASRKGQGGEEMCSWVS
jgi:hypothetical protein